MRVSGGGAVVIDGRPVQPYADAAVHYFDRGWAPLPIVAKAGNLPQGFTGNLGRWPERSDVEFWVEKRGVDNIAVRVPRTVLGIDVDDYGDKQGLATIKKAQEAWGNLPATYRSSSRDGLSGIYFFMVPEGRYFEGKIEIDGTSDVELVSWHYRFAVVSPSRHPDTGSQYRWFRPDRTPMTSAPEPDVFPPLPDEWVRQLEKQAPLERTDPASYEMQYAEPGEWHPEVARVFHELLEVANAPAGSRHDTMLTLTGELCRLERRGKSGATSALEMAENSWVALMGDERGHNNAAREFRDAVNGGRDLIASTPTLAVEEEDIAWAEMVAPLHEEKRKRDAEEAEVEAPAVKGLASELLSLEAVQDLPPPSPLLDGWLFRHSVAALSAPPKSGKTFVALDMALSLAAGVPWVGGRIPKRGRVLYMIGEGVSGVGQRVAAWREAHPNADPSGHIDFIPRAVHLRDQVASFELVKLAAERRYDLIVIDTLARAAVGMEENSVKEMGVAVQVMDDLKVLSDACVLIVHHTGKDVSRGLRGSSAIAGALDTSIVCEGGTTNLWVKTDFQKDAASDSQVQVSFRNVKHSIVPVRAEHDFSRSDSEDRALEILRWAGVPISRTEWLRRLDDEDMDATVAYFAVGELISSGRVVSPDAPEAKGARWMVRDD
jgi:hypothetical protein